MNFFKRLFSSKKSTKGPFFEFQKSVISDPNLWSRDVEYTVEYLTDNEKNNSNKTAPCQKVTDQDSVLSKRELGILELVSQGLSNKEIADQLNLSRYTVESHIKHIYRKLAVCNRAKAIDTARNLGLLD